MIARLSEGGRERACQTRMNRGGVVRSENRSVAKAANSRRESDACSSESSAVGSVLGSWKCATCGAGYSENEEAGSRVVTIAAGRSPPRRAKCVSGDRRRFEGWEKAGESAELPSPSRAKDQNLAADG